MLSSFLRTFFLYLVLVGVIRLMGKRQVGQMEPAEFVVTMLIANLASIPMQDGAIPLYCGVMPILTVLGAELLLSLLELRSRLFRRLLCGQPLMLVENGQPVEKNLRSSRVTVAELTALLRRKDVLDISSVQYAILETNGELSVFPFPENQPPSARELGVERKKRQLPMALVVDGHVLPEGLAAAGMDRSALDRLLESRSLKPDQVLLLTVEGKDKIKLYRRNAG